MPLQAGVVIPSCPPHRPGGHLPSQHMHRKHADQYAGDEAMWQAAVKEEVVPWIEDRSLVQKPFLM